MGALRTDLPGSLGQRKVLVETLTYVSAEPEGTYRYLQAQDVASGHEHRTQNRGLQVIRTTEEGWAGEGGVTVETRLISGSVAWPSQVPVAVLLDAPDDVQDFLEAYAPEVFERTRQWEAELAEGVRRGAGPYWPEGQPDGEDG